MQLSALAEIKDWDGLEAFSRERKPAPATGYEPFIAACKNNGAPNDRTARQVHAVDKGCMHLTVLHNKNQHATDHGC